MKLLVVGLGSMGRRRLRNLTYLGGQELAGVEPRGDRAATVAGEFDIPIFPTVEQAMGWAPEALVISTPPDRHTEYALAAARAGLPFFTEASVVSNGMEELIAEVQSRGGMAAPSCTMRFHPAVQTLRERLMGGAIGRPLGIVHHVGQYLPDWHPWEDYRTFYVSRRETGAAREIVPFELNWLVHVFGNVEALTCIRGKASTLDADIDDIYASALLFEGGVHCSLVVEVLSRPGIRLSRVIGEEGTLIWDWEARAVREYHAGSDRWADFPDPPPIEGPSGSWVSENMYIEEMRAFLLAASGEASFQSSLEEDLYLLRLLEALEASSDRVLEAGNLPRAPTRA